MTKGRLIAASLLVLIALGLAACGGGGSSTGGGASTTSGSSTTESAANSPEATWAKEVQGEMTYFENHVTAQLTPMIQDTYSHVALEPLYRTYGHDLGVLANKLDATKAPAACSALHDRVADLGKRLAQLTTELSERPGLSEKQYSLLLGNQGKKIRQTSIELSELTADPHC